MPYRTHVITTVAALSAAALLAATPAAAAPAAGSSPHEFNGGYRQKLDLAGAVWRTDTETSVTSLELLVFERTVQPLGGTLERSEPVVDVFYDHSDVDRAAGVVIQTSYHGTAGGGLAFELDPSLRSGASVSATAELAGLRCFHPIEDSGAGESLAGEESEPPCVDLPSVTVHVDLTWTQTGKISRDVERLGGVVPPEFQAHARSVAAVSTAVVTGEVAGEGLRLVDGPADLGLLIREGYVEHLLLR